MRILMLVLALFCFSPPAHADARSEAASLLRLAAAESGRPAYSPEEARRRFPVRYNVFLDSALAIDLTYRRATVTLPLYRGLAPDGTDVYYILTEASDFEFARRLGLNYAPKLADAIGSPGAARVEITSEGLITFPGNVDFAPVREVVPGSPTPFPPAVAQPGGVGDAGYTPVLVLPSGVVINAQMMANGTGRHPRVTDIDIASRAVTFLLLDGTQGGQQYYYHLVTESSAPDAAALENGIWAPRMAGLPAFGQSELEDDSALLGFSPVLNGPTEVDPATRLGGEQGFEALLLNSGVDPINVFPVDPENKRRNNNNYSPLWDAHISAWTPAAEAAGVVERIYSVEELRNLVRRGYLTSAPGTPAGPANPFLGGLRPSRAIINCPAILQPYFRDTERLQEIAEDGGRLPFDVGPLPEGFVEE